MTNNQKMNHAEILKEILATPSDKIIVDRFSKTNYENARCKETCSGICGTC